MNQLTPQQAETTFREFRRMVAIEAQQRACRHFWDEDTNVCEWCGVKG